MSRSTFARFAMESEDAVEEGMDTDVSITEEPAVTDTDTADPPTDDNEELGADEPIIFPEVGNLNVDKVAEVLDEEGGRKEMTDDAIEETRTLVAAVEAMQEQIRHNETLSPAMLHLTEAIFKGANARLGAPVTTVKSLSLEGFEDRYNKRPTVRNRSQIALEGFGNAIKTVWEAIIKAIQRAIDWVRKIFSGFFKAAERSKKTTQELMTAILKVRSSPRFDNYINKTSIDEGNYVTLTPDKQKYLSIDGKNPNEVKIDVPCGTPAKPVFGFKQSNKPLPYIDHFDRLINLAKSHENYPVIFGKDFIAQVSDLCNKLSKKEDISTVGVFGSLEILPPAEEVFVFSGQPYKGKIPTDPKNAFLICSGYLGDLVTYNEVNLVAPSNCVDSIDKLSVWKSEVLTATNGGTDGAMPFMKTDDLKACTAKVVELNNVLDKFDGTVDKMVAFQGSMKKLAEEMVIDSVDFQKVDGAPDPANTSRSQILLDLSKMINNVISNINVSLVKIATHLGQVCSSWNAYLKEVLNKEKPLVAQ